MLHLLLAWRYSPAALLPRVMYVPGPVPSLRYMYPVAEESKSDVLMRSTYSFSTRGELGAASAAAVVHNPTSTANMVTYLQVVTRRLYTPAPPFNIATVRFSTVAAHNNLGALPFQWQFRAFFAANRIDRPDVCPILYCISPDCRRFLLPAQHPLRRRFVCCITRGLDGLQRYKTDFNRSDFDV